MITARWIVTTRGRWIGSSSQPRSRWDQVADGTQTGPSRRIDGSRDAHSTLPRPILRAECRPVRLRSSFVHLTRDRPSAVAVVGTTVATVD